jgi:tRNA pseudouridine synthase 10
LVLANSKSYKCLKIFKFEYSLCYFCLKRNFPGFKLNKNKNNNDCFICQGIFSKITEIVKKIFYLIKYEEKYEYSSFSIGTSLPYFMYDKEDYIRSLYKLKNIENIKSSFNFEIRKYFKTVSKKKIELVNPEIKIDLLISKNNDYSVKIISRSFYLIGRYKKTRMLAQKENNYKKNLQCANGTNFNMNKKQSIETIIHNIISNYIKSDRTIFTWSGSEDDNSQVLGNGRLFYINMINPRERKIKINKSFSHNGLTFKITEKKDFIYNVNRNYRVKNKIFLQTTNSINNFYLIQLRKLKNSIIRYYYKSKYINKKIYDLKIKKVDSFHLIIFLECDGGLFLRPFIEGKTFMQPNITSILKNQCECLKFDILDISYS